AASRLNIQWLEEQGLCARPQYQLFTQDAVKPNPELAAALRPLAAVVTEGTLGPPQMRPLPDPVAKKLWETAFSTIVRMLQTIQPALGPATKIVFCLPLYRTAKGWHDPRTVVKSQLQNWQLATPLNYFRPEQIVGRQIWQLTPRAKRVDL
ncbi:MAG: hypothetical protein Q8P59_09665, partial [Dehalococcoidia bacterium]|nr:hypothetical protein [Dehalococcoidia bacterium]